MVGYGLGFYSGFELGKHEFYGLHLRRHRRVSQRRDLAHFQIVSDYLSFMSPCVVHEEEVALFVVQRRHGFETFDDSAHEKLVAKVVYPGVTEHVP